MICPRIFSEMLFCSMHAIIRLLTKTPALTPHSPCAGGPSHRLWPGQRVGGVVGPHGVVGPDGVISPLVHEFLGPHSVRWNSPRALCVGGRSCF